MTDVAQDDRAELEALGVHMVPRSELQVGSRLVECRIVKRARGFVVARVVVDHPFGRGADTRIARATRALLVAINPVTGDAIRTMHVRSADLEAALEGLASVAAFVEDVRRREGDAA